MLLIMAVLVGLVFIMCMGLLRVLKELLADRNTFDSKFLLLSSCAALAFAQAPVAKSQPAFAVTVVTPAGDQFWTNSIIIEGTHEVMLVDAQLTKTNAEKVLQEIKATQKPLSIIYLTHEHAELGATESDDARATLET